ncbi:MAG TPA: helix-turn-helix transcriptional regulator [Clostridiales bacterium]|nr:helix-turn-helix transcriptional regulator [Clostridiales bacterium]
MDEQATKREKQVYGNDVEIMSRNDECTVYRLSGETGDVVMTSYHVFDGIDLIYNDVHIQSCNVSTAKIGNMFEINHCREGRIEVGFKNEYFYLEPGDLAIGKKDEASHESYFPTSHYHGITIMVDANRAPDCLSCFLDDVDVRPSSLIKKFCTDTNCYVVRSDKRIEHVFSELYSVRDRIRKGYFKIKVLELLLFLSDLEVDIQQTQQRLYLPSQVSLAKRACQFITAHLSEKITIDQLAELFHVSPTQLKNCFMGVYGMSVYSYIRAQKMHAAANTLKTTDYTVLDIGNRFGYDNGSKFAKAFKDVMGMTPNEYRKENQ